MKSVLLQLAAVAVFAPPVVFAAIADGLPAKTPEPPPAVIQPAVQTENPVPDIWEIVRNDNQAAADICAARGR